VPDIRQQCRDMAHVLGKSLNREIGHHHYAPGGDAKRVSARSHMKDSGAAVGA
jgi:hypothetical protein